MKKHLQLLALIAAFLLPWSLQAQRVTIGTGTDDSYSPSPFCNFYNNGMSQTLYLASEINTSGVIDTIWFYSGSSYSVASTNIHIYLATTTNTTLTGFLPASSFDEVYAATGSAATLGGTTGWIPFVLETPYYYAGTDNLVVCCTRQSGNYDSDVTWRYTSMSGRLVYRQSDGDANYGDITSTTGGQTSSYMFNIRFHFDSNYVAPSCMRPYSVTAANVSATTADISWVDTNSSISGLRLYYYPSGTPSARDSVDFTSNDTAYQLTGLLSNTVYSVDLVALCNDATITNARSTSFRTLCSDLTTLPYTMTFEAENTTSSTTGSAFVNCWQLLNNGTSYGGYPYVGASTTYNHTPNGTKGLYWYASTTTGSYGDYMCIVFPGVDTDIYAINTLQVTMWAKSTSTSYYPTFQIGVMTDPTDITTFTQVGTANVGNNTAWGEYITNLSSYTGYGRFVAIKAVRPTSAWYAYVDDLQLSVAPACPRVENITVSNVTTSSADVAWTETGTGTSWTVEYGPQGFTPGDTTAFIAYATDTVVTLTGLSANTPYDVYVTVDCGSDVGGVNQTTFRTLCTAIDSLPYTQTFEAEAGGSSTTGSAFANCWQRLNNGTMYGGWPYVGNSTTYNHTAGGSKGLYWYNSTTTGTYGDYQCIVFPAVDTDAYAINTLQVKFWAKSTSASYYPVFQVGVMTDPFNINTFQQVGTINVGNSTIWDEYLASLSTFTGAGQFVAIKAVRPSSAWYAYVDDITLETAPACPEVYNMAMTTTGVSSASVEWSIRGGLETPASYEVEITALDSTSSPDTYTATTLNYTFSGLTAATQYKVRVRANCSNEDGPWDSITFSTQALPCVQLDPTSLDSLIFSNGTSAGSGCLVNSSWGNTAYQTIYTASELLAAGLTPGPIIGIDLGFSASSSYNKEFSIWMANSSVTSIATSTLVSPADHQQVYGPTVHSTGTPAGWKHYTFAQPFMWDGSSSIMMTTIMNQYGSSQSSSGFSGYYTSISSRAAYRYQDSSPFSASNINSGSSTTTTYRASIHFYTGACAAYADCVAPLAQIDSTDPYTIHVSWAPGYQETAWSVEYRQGTSGSWTTEESSTSNTSISITNLTPATKYQVRIGALCTSETEYTVLDVQTPCVATAVPFTENFDSWGTGTASPAPACWYKYCNYNSYGTTYPYVSTSYAHSGSQSMYFYSYLYSSYMYICLPLLQPQVDSLQVNFWAYRSSSYTCPIHVGVMEDPEDFTTFTTVGTYSPVYGSGWTEFECQLSSYTGTGSYIALAFPPNTSSSYPYVWVDDITVDYIPSCPRTTAINTRNVTGTEATVYWTASANATEYEVEYGLHGFAQGYGTVLTTTDDSIRLTGLASTSQYDVYMRSICGSGDTSWSRNITFATACGTIDALPYTEDFESYGSGTTCFPNCWYKRGSTADRPYIHSTTSYGHNNTHGLYFYAASGGYCYAIMPPTSHSIDSLQVSFWARQYSTSYNSSLVVGVMSDPNNVSTFVPVDTVHPATTTYEAFEVTLNSYTDTGRYIAFSSIIYSGSDNYIMLDDVTLDYMPDCPAVSNIHLAGLDSSMLSVTWTERGNATSWDIEYGPHGFVQGNGTTDVATSLPYVITGLTPNTQYDIYIAPSCSGVVSPRMGTFRTECGGLNASDLPYSYGFEDATGAGAAYDINSCWKRLNNYSTNYPYPSSTTPHSGSRNLYFYSSSPYYSCLVMPAYNGGVENLQVKFWTRSSSAGSAGYGDLQVGVMTDPYDISTFQLIELTNNSTTNWVQQAVLLSSYTGTGKYIAFRKPATSSGYTYLDDIVLDLLPTCPEMRNLDVDNVRAVSANATWNFQQGVTATAPAFDLECIEDQTGTIVVTETALTGNSYMLTGLSPMTEYKLRMRASCVSGEYGPWDSVYFQTRCISGGKSDPSGTATNQISGVPVNSAWGNTVCQTVYTAAELTSWGMTAGPIYGMEFTWTTNSSYNKQFTIFLNNTTATAASSTIAAPGTQCYTGAHNIGVTGTVEYTFTTPFQWDGTSNIMLTTFMNQNGGSQSSSSFYGLSTDCGVTRTGYRYQDGTAWTTSNLTSGNAGSTYGYRPNVSFITPCDTTVSCAAPNVVVDSFANGDLYLSWAPGYLETSWDVDYRRADSTMWTNVTYGTTSTNVVISGLTANTSYVFRVGAVCSDTTVYALVAYRTPCVAYSVPFTENFATFSTSTADPLPSCWEKHTNYSTNYPYASTSYSRSGGRSMYMYSTSTTYSYMVLPLMQPSIDSLQVSFWLYKTNSSYAHRLEVGVMTDPADVTTFTRVAYATPQQVSTWEPFEIPLNTYTGNGQYIAIMSPNGEYSYPYLDELEVTYISSCPRVRNVSASNITQNSASLSWTATAASSYEVEYGTSGFTQGTGTLLTTYDDTLTIFGLHATGTYDVYVRGICSSDTGNWSFRYTFNTACGLIDSVPFFQNFNNIGTGTTIHSPLCWTGASTYSTSYPYPSNSYSRSGGGASMYMYYYNSGSYYTMLQLPQVDTTELPINTLQLEFSLLSSYSGYTQGVVVGVCTAPGMVGFVPVDTVWVTEPDYVWQDFEIPLNNYSGNGSYITFKAYSGSSSYCYPYLDDVRLVNIPTCIRPDEIHATTISTSSATVQWTLRDSTQTEFEIRCGATGCNPDTIQGVIVTGADTLLITGLDSGAYYDVYVRAICGLDDTSLWTMGSFRTLASSPVTTYPYSCDFTGIEGQAWNLENGTQANIWYVGQGAYNGTADSMGLYISNTNGTSASYNTSSISHSWAYRTFNMPAGQYAYSYDWKCLGESNYYDFLRVFLIPAGETIAAGVVPGGSTYTFGTTPTPTGWIDLTQVTTSPYTLAGSSSWQNINGTFDINTTGTYNLAFVWSNDGSGGSNPPACVDNVMIAQNICPAPSNFRATANTGTTVTVAWDTIGNPDYELSISTTTGNPSVDTVIYNGNSCTFPNLVGGTHYYVYVRSNCGSDSSMWVGPIDVVPGTWTMRTNMTDTLYTCSAVVYDDGGATGDYTNSQNSTLIIMPPDASHLISVSGTWQGEGCCDYIGIYDGVGTGAQQLYRNCSSSGGTTMNLGPYTSTDGSGAITINVTSDGSVTYSGLVLNVQCIYAGCRVGYLRIDTAYNESDSYLAITWNDDNNSGNYQIEYGPHGFTQGTGTFATSTTTSYMIQNLTALTSYDVYVRSICSASDTGSWSVATFSTAMCANANITSTGAQSGTSYYAPVNNYYNYTLTETIIDSAELGGPQTISAIAYYYNYSSSPTAKTDVDIYLQPTTKTAFSGTSDMVALDSNAVLVYSGSLSPQQGWNIYQLDTTYDYSGTGNLLVIVDDNSGDYDNSSYVYGTSACTGNKTIYYYSDSYNPSVTAPSGFSGSMDVVAWRPTMQLISCGGAGCQHPVLGTATTTYQSATVAWTGSGTSYEVALLQSGMWSTETAVTGTTHTFTGLQPATTYSYRVRQDCSVDSLGYSEWTTGTFTTDSMPCFAPTNFQIQSVTGNSATFGWTAADASHTSWEIRIYNTTFDSTYAVATNPATITGLQPGLPYNANIRTLCGAAHNIEGMWGDSVITFTLAACPAVTGLDTVSVSFNQVVLSWTADPLAQSWVVEYGILGFNQGSGSTVTVTAPTATITGLTDELTYSFYVKTVCGTNWESESWQNIVVTTDEAPADVVNVTALANNNAWGTVTGGGSYAEGSTVTLTATPAEHCEFLQWADGVTANPRTVVVNTDTTFIANFAQIPQYTITVDANDAEMGTVAGGGQYYRGETATLTATANEGYAFQYWNDGNTDNPRTIIVTANAAYTAMFASDSAGPVTTYTVTLTVNNPDMGAVTGAGTYVENSSVTIAAIPNNGYHFVTWSDGNTDAERTFIITADVDLMARFAQDEQEGIETVDGALTCTVYPNPAHSTANISVSGVNGQVRIMLLDMSGRTVASETMECSADCVKSMDVDGLAAGTYFVRVVSEQASMVQKLIVR